MADLFVEHATDGERVVLEEVVSQECFAATRIELNYVRGVDTALRGPKVRVVARQVKAATR